MIDCTFFFWLVGFKAKQVMMTEFDTVVRTRVVRIIVV